MVGRVRVSEITAPDGLSAVAAPYGVKFNNNASSNANTLDWYEEGVWTPSLTDGTNSVVHTTQLGWFTRIGNIVHCSFHIVYSSKGSISGGLRLYGLPFPVTSATSYRGGAALSYAACMGSSANSTIFINLDAGNNFGYLREKTGVGAGLIDVPASTLVASPSSFQGTFFYPVS